MSLTPTEVTTSKVSHWRGRGRTKVPLGVSPGPRRYSEVTLHHFRDAREPPSQGVDMSNIETQRGQWGNQGGLRAGFLGSDELRQTLSYLAVPSAATEASRDWTADWLRARSGISMKVSQDAGGGSGGPWKPRLATAKISASTLMPSWEEEEQRRWALKNQVSTWKGMI